MTAHEDIISINKDFILPVILVIGLVSLLSGFIFAEFLVSSVESQRDTAMAMLEFYKTQCGGVK